MKAHDWRCAACIVNIMNGDAEIIRKEPDGALSKRKAVSFDDAMAAIGKGERVQHHGHYQRFSLVAITVIGGTPACPDHAAGTWRAWARSA